MTFTIENIITVVLVLGAAFYIFRVGVKSLKSLQKLSSKGGSCGGCGCRPKVSTDETKDD